MDQVDFEPAKQWIALRLHDYDHLPPTRSHTTLFFMVLLNHVSLYFLIPHSLSLPVSDLGGIIPTPPVIIRSGGGIHNYLYKLVPSAHVSGQSKFQASSILGKFQITWRTNLGEPGRLQTQQILGAVSSPSFTI